MTNYRLFPSTNGPVNAATSGDWLLGVAFSVTGGMNWFSGYWLWAATGGDTTARKCALWNRYSTTAQQVVSGTVVTSGTLTLNSWNFVPLAAPVQLAPGALYVAASGWVATNGIPVGSNQFGNGEPFAGGIVNGPLTGWSSGTGTNPASSAAYNFSGQMVFSQALGNDPSVAMPNNGSGDDNLGMDLQISDTAPLGYAGSYRFWPNMADLGVYSLDTADNFTLGTEFSLSQTCTINNIWFFSPPTVTQLPTDIGVYSTTGPTLVASSNSPSWSGAAGAGWVSAPLPGTLAAGQYKVAVCNGAGSPAAWNAANANYWASPGFGASGLTSGPLSAPNNATATSPGQETYNAGASLTFPGTNVGPYHYGTDIEVTPQVTPPPAAPVLYSMRMMP